MRHTVGFPKFLHHLMIAVIEEGADEVVVEHTVECHLIPILLVPMPCTFHLGMDFAQVDGTHGVALHGDEIGAFKVDAGKNFAKHTEGECTLVERKTLCYEGQRKTVFAYGFDVRKCI